MPQPTPSTGPPIPITIITGFLGSGKTTLILSLLPQLPSSYKLALLKNEFGDLAIDSQLASSRSISGVQELLNGCICCNLVGQLSDALETLRHEQNPDRIVIETSGSAFPATLAMEVNRLARETRGAYVLDGVLSVVDVENWKGYEDTSYTAAVQAKYTDLIVLNKWEGVDERRLEEVEDRILDLEVEPPIPRTKSDRGWVSKEVVFGLDANLAGRVEGLDGEGDGGEHKHEHGDGHGHDHSKGHQSEVEVLSVKLPMSSAAKVGVDIEKLGKLLSTATKDEIYRIKAVLHSNQEPKPSDGSTVGSNTASPQKNGDISTPTPSGPSRYILNWAFGRWTYTNITPSPTSENTSGATDDAALRMTIITARFESNQWKKQIEKGGYIVLEDGSSEGLAVDKLL